MAFIFDISKKSFRSSDGSVRSGFVPSISFGEKPVWKILLIDGSADDTSSVDTSQAFSWRAAIDQDFRQETDPMCRTTSGITVEVTDSGPLFSVPLNTATTRFLEVCNGKQSSACWFELAGMDANGDTVFYVSFAVSCLFPIDPQAAGVLEAVNVTTLTQSQVEAIASACVNGVLDARLASEIANALSGIRQVPDGGEAGQVLTKTADGAEWSALPAQDAVAGLPDGGEAGQVLTKTADGAEWKDAPSAGDGGGSSSSGGSVDMSGYATINQLNAGISSIQSNIANKLDNPPNHLDDSTDGYYLKRKVSSSSSGTTLSHEWANLSDDVIKNPGNIADGRVLLAKNISGSLVSPTWSDPPFVLNPSVGESKDYLRLNANGIPYWGKSELPATDNAHLHDVLERTSDGISWATRRVVFHVACDDDFQRLERMALDLNQYDSALSYSLLFVSDATASYASISGGSFDCQEGHLYRLQKQDGSSSTLKTVTLTLDTYKFNMLNLKSKVSGSAHNGRYAFNFYDSSWNVLYQGDTEISDTVVNTNASGAKVWPPTVKTVTEQLAELSQNDGTIICAVSPSDLSQNTGCYCDVIVRRNGKWMYISSYEFGTDITERTSTEEVTFDYGWYGLVNGSYTATYLPALKPLSTRSVTLDNGEYGTVSASVVDITPSAGSSSACAVTDFSDAEKAFGASDVDKLFRYSGTDCAKYRAGNLYVVRHTSKTVTTTVTHTTGGSGEDPYGLVVAYSGSNATLKDAVGQYVLFRDDSDQYHHREVFKHRTKEYYIKSWYNLSNFDQQWSICSDGDAIPDSSTNNPNGNISYLPFSTEGKASVSFATKQTNNGISVKWTIANGFPLSFTFAIDSEGCSNIGLSETTYAAYAGTYTKTGVTNTIDGVGYPQYSNGSKYIVFRKVTAGVMYTAGTYVCMQNDNTSADSATDDPVCNAYMSCCFDRTFSWSASMADSDISYCLKFVSATPDTGAQTTTEEVETTTDYYTPCPVKFGADTVVELSGNANAVTFGNSYRWTLSANSTLSLVLAAPGVVGKSVIEINPGAFTLALGDGMTLSGSLVANTVNRCEIVWNGESAVLKVGIN